MRSGQRLRAALALAALLSLGGASDFACTALAGVGKSDPAPTAAEPDGGKPAADAKPSPDAKPAAEAPAPPAPPPPPRFPEIQEPVAALGSTIENLERAVERATGDEDELARLRFDIEGLASGAELIKTHLEPRLSAVRNQIDALGPPPGKDDAPESAQLAAEREKLSAISSEISSAMKATELVQERSRQLGDKVQSLRQAIFADRILARSRSPLSPKTWDRFLDDLPTAGRQLRHLATSWLDAARDAWQRLAALIAAVLLLYAGLTALIGRFLAHQLDRDPHADPSFFARGAAATWVAPLHAAPATAAVLMAFWGLDNLGLLVSEVGRVSTVALTGASIYIAVSALAMAMLQPHRRAWRLVDLADAPARSVARTLKAIAAVYGLDVFLTELARLLFMPLSVSVMLVTVSSLVIGLLLFHLVRVRFLPLTLMPGEGDVPASTPAGTPVPFVSIFSPRLIKLPLLAIAGAILGAVLLGYVALGRFIVGQLLVTGSAAVLVLVAHLAIRALLGAPGSGIKPFPAILSERAGLTEDQGVAVTRGLSILLDAALALLAVPLLLLTWGYTLPEALDWLESAIFGFEIGTFRISFARIALAILLFLSLLFATRLVQRWLQAGPLQSSKIDRGIADSVYTAVGYAGFVLAALVAISYGGLDITSFAIVAGALSVGIGFGLQSIVNNFVSGLILLVERPIKVGDLVAVGGREGRVRSISVRSTEIETGDKASLIVPNSQLITGTVTNWTHRNALGRVLIKVNSSYSTDPEHVMAVLQRVAGESPLIMQHPPPGVSLDNFGANGFEYSLSAVVSDVGRAGAAQTDLRLKIVRAFRAEGIELPHAQSDVHLRDLDKLWALFSRIAAERKAQNARDAGITEGLDEETAVKNG